MAMSKHPRWEYKTVVISRKLRCLGLVPVRPIEFSQQLQERLVELGADGWELVSMLPNSYRALLVHVTAIFNRPAEH